MLFRSNIPEDDPQTLLSLFNNYCEQTIVPDMRRVELKCSITTAQRAAAPAMRPEPHGRAEALCQYLLGHHDSTAVSYATEGGQFQEAGYSTIVCGPGSIDQAHQVDEYIELSQIENAEVFLSRLIHQQTG